MSIPERTGTWLQVNDGPPRIVHGDDTVWLSVDGEGVGHSVKSWLRLAEQHELDAERDAQTPAERPVRWQPDLQQDQPRNEQLRSLIFQALGRASVCWEDMGGTGVFDSDTAAAVGDYVYGWVRSNYDEHDPARQVPDPARERDEAGQFLRLDLVMRLLAANLGTPVKTLIQQATELERYVLKGSPE